MRSDISSFELAVLASTTLELQAAIKIHFYSFLPSAEWVTYVLVLLESCWKKY